MAYEGERAMFEAYGRNKYTSTGVIQWMLNNAWPSMIWHLYDYYLRPGAGFYGTKKACELLHVQYSYDDRSVAVVNGHEQGFSGLKVKATILDLGLKEIFSKVATVDVASDGVTRAFVLSPEGKFLTTTYFLWLSMEDAGGKPISSNFYWLSTKPSVFEWHKTDWKYTPLKENADLRGLKDLPHVTLKVSSEALRDGDEGRQRVRLENPTSHLAFLVHLKVTKGKGGAEVLPALWEDNYFELLPGETRILEGSFRLKDLDGAQPEVEVDGWNVGS
jgi:exo-1,4-beta-D-glucosaminidase